MSNGRNQFALKRLKKLLTMALPAAVLMQATQYYFAGTLSPEVAVALIVVPVIDAIRKWLVYDPAKAAPDFQRSGTTIK